MLLDDFAKALSIPQHVVMTEILAVRETNTYNIHTSDLAAKIPGSCWFGSFEEIADYVMTHAKENDLILTLGGGDIYKCANLIVENTKREHKFLKGFPRESLFFWRYHVFSRIFFDI